MKVLLIHPPYRHGRYMLPTGMAYVAAYLLQAGHDVKVLDVDAFIFTDEELKQKLLQEEYDVLAIGCLVTAYNFVIRISNFIKKVKPSVAIVVGGTLPTYSYEILLNNSSVDFCVIGEGELTAVELLSALQEKKDLNTVKGVAYKQDGSIVVTEERDLIKNLDDLLLPARDIFYAEEVYSRNTTIDNIFKAGRHLSICGSRGCPNSCTFCSYDTRVRFRSAESLVEELRHMKQEYKIKNFRFEDDLFMIKEERVAEFCKLLLKGKLNLHWAALGRVNNVNKNILRLMKQAGCHNLGYGIESGSPRLLKSMKKNISPEQVKRAIKITRESKIWPGGSWILGMPGEDKESIKMSVNLYKSINRYRNCCDGFFFATPYPGTELYRCMQEKSRIIDEHKYLVKISNIGDAFKFAINCTDSFTDKQLIEIKSNIEAELRKDFYIKHPFLYLGKLLKLEFAKRLIIFFKLNGLKGFFIKLKEKINIPSASKVI